MKLRISYAKKEAYNKDNEINLFDFVPDLLTRLHKELNKEKNNSENKSGQEIDHTNEKMVLSATMKRFTENYRSKITDQFFIYQRQFMNALNANKKNYKILI